MNIRARLLSHYCLCIIFATKNNDEHDSLETNANTKYYPLFIN